MNLHDQLEKQLHRLRARRRRLRWLLKKLPRKANVGRYPGLGRFANAARKRPWLWSFKRAQILPAVYVGTVLSLMPTYGIQFVIAFGAALLFRANLTVMAGLQLITNPLTIAPIYLFTDWLGMWLIEKTGYGYGINEVGTHFNALILGCRPKTRLCLATDLTLSSERIATRRVSDWKDSEAPDLDKRPTVFLLLAD